MSGAALGRVAQSVPTPLHPPEATLSHADSLELLRLIADTQLALVLSVATPPARTVDLAHRLVGLGTRLLDRAQNPRAPDYAAILDRCLRLHLLDNRSDEEQGSRLCKLGPHPMNEEWDVMNEGIWSAAMDLLERLNRSGALAGDGPC